VQSTPYSESGDFYELIEAADPDWARFTVRSDEVPTISPEFLAGERKSMSPDEYAREFETQFGKAGASLFSAERIASLVLAP
jgi:hypothetical protein